MLDLIPQPCNEPGVRAVLVALTPQCLLGHVAAVSPPSRGLTGCRRKQRLTPQTATLSLAKLDYHTCLRPHSSLVAFPKSTGTELPSPWEVPLSLTRLPLTLLGWPGPRLRWGQLRGSAAGGSHSAALPAPGRGGEAACWGDTDEFQSTQNLRIGMRRRSGN